MLETITKNIGKRSYAYKSGLAICLTYLCRDGLKKFHCAFADSTCKYRAEQWFGQIDDMIVDIKNG
ncbi:hypothetical protein D3C87_1636110 [compost metagenome]